MKNLHANENKSGTARAVWYLLQRGKQRRRAHQASTGLQAGLAQFYQAVAGATHLCSWNETELVPDNPFAGLDALFTDGASGGTYHAGDLISYSILPYREIGSRVYAGLSLQIEVITAENDAIIWPAWSGSPTWVTGYTILRRVNDVYAWFRDVNVATMFAGWTDDASGWSLASALPFDFNNPPDVAKVLWNLLEEFSQPQVMATVAWTGGTAFDSGASSTQLVRAISEDLRRSLDGTLAFWMCPNQEGRVAVVSGVNKSSFRLYCAGAGSGVEFGDSGNVFVDGHQAGDWYLVVMRNDTGSNTLTIDALRQRDLVQVSATLGLPVYCGALGAGDNYLEEGVGAALSIGGPWFTDIGIPAYFDRIGLWNRPLTNAEVLELFNNGNGWLPT